MMSDFLDDIRLVNDIHAVPLILDLVCKTTGMGFSAVARVTEDRWIACSVRDEIGFGLTSGSELAIETTICNEIREHRQPVIIENVAEDPAYRDHHTPATYGLQSYISVPIFLSDGSFFGTLCAIDPQPKPIDQPHIRAMFSLFSEMIGHQIEANRVHAARQNELIGEREASALREEFIAVLSHDLRNPLAGIQGGMRLLEREALSDRGTKVLGMVNDTVERMSGLIDNVMDFARGRLGGGITLTLSRRSILATIEQVVSELRSGHPNRRIETSLVDHEIRADHGRLAQLASNLLGNALTHGAADQPIWVSSRIVDGHFELRVANGGGAIPAAAMKRLFIPFARGEVRSSLQGLGLGLYICSQIALAHGGTLKATSTSSETAFLFRMPLQD
jgi:signal transduction histidine kinase